MLLAFYSSQSRLRHLIYLVCLCGWVGECDAAGETAVVAEPVEMLVTLHQENQQLKSQVSNLVNQILALELKLAEVRMASDAKLVEQPVETPAATRRINESVVVDPSKVEILEVNREMMVAVVSGGMRSGMKSGMRFSVVRDGDVLAVVRVTEVRENIAGGLIEWNEKSAFPEVGDRLVLRSMQDG